MTAPSRNDEARGRRATAQSEQQSSHDSNASAPRYAVVDRRADGRRRIIGEYRDPEDARKAALLMAWAGDAVDVVLVSAIRDDEAAP